jgi:Cu/Ag efflux protein CusF
MPRDHRNLLDGSPLRRFALRLGLAMILPAILCVACGQQTQREKTSESPQPATVAKNPLEWPSPVIGKPYSGTGVVMLINLKEGWIEIKHEEIKELMPAMTMEWWVTDRSLLKSVQVGDKVDFTVVETGKGEYITELKRKP